MIQVLHGHVLRKLCKWLRNVGRISFAGRKGSTIILRTKLKYTLEDITWLLGDTNFIFEC